jgi:hypothetical protein
MRRALFLFAFFSPAAALADVVVLSDGQEIRGVVTESGDDVTVRLDFGSVSFSRSEIAEIRRESTPLTELEQRRAKLDANDAAGRLTLARWAEQNGLSESARDLYREVVSLRPDDAAARQALGYRKHEGRWMTEEEHLAATGHVRYGGTWVTKEESERLEKEASERRAKLDQERIARLETEVAQQKKQLEEIESRPEPEYGDSVVWGGWWLPHHPAFVYQDLLHPHQHRHHQRRAVQQPQVNLRGRLQGRQGPVVRGNVGLQRP